MQRYTQQVLEQKSFSPHRAWGLAGWPVEAFWFPSMEALQNPSFWVFIRKLHHIAMIDELTGHQ